MGSRMRRWFEPVDVFQGGVVDVVEAAPWSPIVDEFGLVGADVVGVGAPGLLPESRAPRHRRSAGTNANLMIDFIQRANWL